MATQKKLSIGMIAIGIFLFFGAVMASLAGTTLVCPGTLLDRMWSLNAPAHSRLAPFGKTAGILFLLLSGTLVIGGAGWFRRRVWAWRLAVAIIATQILGDLVNAFQGDFVRGGAGFMIAVTLLIYLLRPEVRAVFSNGHAASVRSQNSIR